jgi:putative FmdB family regulatory protein
MPTYEYRCPKGHEFEHFFGRISESTSTFPCPECGELAERRISGGAGLVFKGSGFYLTDYGKNAHRGGAAPAGAAPKGDGAKPGGDAGAGGGGDAKPAGGDAKPAGGAEAKPGAKAESKPAAKPSGSGE